MPLLLLFCAVLHLSISCMLHFNIGTCLLTLDHVEPETEELTEQVPTEDLTNRELSQGKLQCI
jgi:hypothetical protein